MGTVREWTQCSVKSIIALREWTFYEGVETAGILKSFAIETIRIIYDLQFCYFDGTTRIGIISHGAMFSQGGAKRYTYRCLYLKGCILDSQGLYPEPQGSIASGIQRSKYQSCRIERGWPEGTFATRTSLCKISQANEFICTNIGTDNSHILIR